jgi:hypothetical protein
MLLAVAGMLAFAGTAMGNSLSVTAAAAIEGNFGLAVFHDNTSLAFVEDRNPTAEAVFRASFLFNTNDLAPGFNLRQRIARFEGPNPRPGVGNCTNGTRFPTLDLWLFLVGGSGQNYALQLYGAGNQCGFVGTNQFQITPGESVRICLEYESGNGGTGRIALAVVDAASACPSTGISPFSERDLNNGFTNIETARIGTVTLNGFGAGQDSTLYFDSYESFRNLFP